MKQLQIDYKSFLLPGLKYNKDEDFYFNAIIGGFQGSGKTYFAVKMATELNIFKSIVTNIQSLQIPNITINKIRKLGEIYQYGVNENILYIIDEIHKKFPKESKQDIDFYSFLQQMRKKHSCCLLITQEWTQTPTWLRYPMKYIYSTRKIPFSKIFNTQLLDAQQISWSTELGNWIAPTISTYIYKRIKKIGNYYDTNEIIDAL